MLSKNISLRLLHKDFNLDLFIRQALKEDIGNGDHTSISTIPSNTRNKANLIIKDNGILAGVELAKKIFHAVDKNLKVTVLKNDGEKIKKGDIAFTVEGSARRSDERREG